MLLRSSFPHPADVEAEEVEALVDVDDAGLLRRQAQPQRGQHGRHLRAQRLGVLAFPGHHDDEVVGVADQPPVAQPVA